MHSSLFISIISCFNFGFVIYSRKTSSILSIWLVSPWPSAITIVYSCFSWFDAQQMFFIVFYPKFNVFQQTSSENLLYTEYYFLGENLHIKYTSIISQHTFNFSSLQLGPSLLNKVRVESAQRKDSNTFYFSC